MQKKVDLFGSSTRTLHLTCLNSTSLDLGNSAGNYQYLPTILSKKKKNLNFRQGERSQMTLPQFSTFLTSGSPLSHQVSLSRDPPPYGDVTFLRRPKIRKTIAKFLRPLKKIVKKVLKKCDPTKFIFCAHSVRTRLAQFDKNEDKLNLRSFLTFRHRGGKQFSWLSCTIYAYI